ncbi:MAG: hypothetical protein V4805_19605 [Pseudomonadota bacterium]
MNAAAQTAMVEKPLKNAEKTLKTRGTDSAERELWKRITSFFNTSIQGARLVPN